MKSGLFCDLYALTMANSYFLANKHEEIVHFDVFFRNMPENGGYAVFAGLETTLKFLKQVRFKADELKYLTNLGIFAPEFLAYLKDFKFKGEVYSFKEGSLVFAKEPIMTIKGTLVECQLVEAFILNSINFETLISTKAARIVKAAKGRAIFEFGTRRAHSSSAAIKGARAAYLAGALATSNVLAGKTNKIPVVGTMAHSYVQAFNDEYTAFLTWAKHNPGNISLLIDTYSTISSGLANTIKLQKEVLDKQGLKVQSVRIDSGDIAYLSKQIRKRLDSAGMSFVKICATNSLDEYIITDLLSNQGAKVDLFGVGERLITASAQPVLGAVYKLAATVENGAVKPKIKVSATVEKTTLPGVKEVFRIYKEDKAIGDLIALKGENLGQDTTVFALTDLQTKLSLKDCKLVPTRALVFKDGEILAKDTLVKARKRLSVQFKEVWPEVLRLSNPHPFYVDITESLKNLQTELINKAGCDA